MRTSGLALILLAFPLHTAAGQHWQAAPSATRFNWGTVYVLVSADTLHGVSVLAMTSTTHYGGSGKSYGADFDPAQVEPWLAKASAVVKYEGPPTSDSALALETPALGSSDGGGLIVRRLRHKHSWDKRVTLIFAVPSGKAWAISAQHDEALAFLQGLALGAEQGRLVPLAADSANGPATCLELDQPPWRLGGPPLSWPVLGAGEARRSSEVLLQYVIGVDGSAEPASFEALWFDDPRFVDEAVKVVAASKFRPGVLHGQPVRTVVRQPVIFRTN